MYKYVLKSLIFYGIGSAQIELIMLKLVWSTFQYNILL